MENEFGNVCYVSGYLLALSLVRWINGVGWKERNKPTADFTEDPFRDPNDSTGKPVFLYISLTHWDIQKRGTQKTPIIPAEQNGALSGWIIPSHQLCKTPRSLAQVAYKTSHEVARLGKK